MYLYLPSTCLSSVYHPFIICFPSPGYISIAHLFPRRPAMYRLLIYFPVARLYINSSSISHRLLYVDSSSASLPPGCASIPHVICVFPVARLYADPSCYLRVPRRPAVRRCLVVSLRVCLTITPCSSHRRLSGSAVLTSFSVSVSLAGLSRSLCARGSSPHVLRLLERQLGRLLLARGP